jgi:four helix bundle protein
MQSEVIARQLFRSATSVGANIAEGHGRHEGQEYIHYLIIAQGSANETDHWLHTALECKFGKPEEILRIIDLNNETRKMLTATINSLKLKSKPNAVRESSTAYTLDDNFPIPYSPIPTDDDINNYGDEA